MDFNRAAFKLFLSKSGNSILFFVGITFFARRLPADQLGAFFLFQAVMGLLMIPADLGVRGALEKRLSEGEEPERTLGSALAFKVVTLALVSACVLALRPQTNAYLGADLAVLLVVAIVVTEFAKFFIHVVRGELRVGETALIEFTNRAIWIGLGMVLVTLGYGAQGIVLGLIAGSVVGFVWAYWRSDTAVGRPSVTRTKSLIAFSKYQTVTSVGGRIYQWTDIVVIGFFLSQAHVSAYEISWQVTLLVLLVSKSLALSLFPQISRWSEESAYDDIESSISQAIAFALFVSIPAVIGGSIYATEILGLIFGPEYTIASTVLVVLLIEKVFQSFHDIIESSVRAVDRPDLAAKATVVAVGLNLVLNPILVVWLGFVGAAIATTVAWFVNTVLHAMYLSRLLTIEIPYRLVGWYAVASLVMGGALVFVKSMVPVTGLPLLVVQIAIGVAVYVAVSTAIPDVRNRTIVPGIRLL